jgi:ribokinase
MVPPDAPLVAVLGSINLDLKVGVDELPRPGQTVLGSDVLRGLGGKGANQAAAVAQLLGRCRMVGAVGQDPEGQWLLSQLAGFGVDVQAVQRHDASPTRLALIGVDAHGENSIIVSPGANANVKPDSAALRDADVLMVQFEIPMTAIVSSAEAFEGFLAVNPSPCRPIPTPLLDRADLFVVNAGEFESLPELAGAPMVVVTLGADGAELRQFGRTVETVSAAAVDRVQSSVGAGDAFFAGLTCALVSGGAPGLALSAATRVAAAALDTDESQARLHGIEHYLMPWES